MSIKVSKSMIQASSPPSMTFDLIPTKEEAITSLFVQMKLMGSSEAYLRNEIYKFDKGQHTFQVENNLVYVARQSSENEISTGFFSIEKKSFFAFGGGGKVYAIKGSDQPLVLKLSRKLLHTLNAEGHKISLPLLENSRTPLGQVVANAILNELFVVDQIIKNCTSSTGLNVDIFAKVFFRNQVGYLNKAFSYDLFDFINEETPSPQIKLDIMNQLFEGLANLHSIGLRHRDLKLENIFLNPKDRGFDAVISDFGNTYRVSRFFSKKLPHPTIQILMSGTSKKYASRNNASLIKEELDAMSKCPQESEEYQKGITRIDQLLIDSDQFTLALCCYVLWTSQEPNFASIRSGGYFDFDSNLTQKVMHEKLDQLYKKLHTATHQISRSTYGGNPHYIAEKIFFLIAKGLGVEIG